MTVEMLHATFRLLAKAIGSDITVSEEDRELIKNSLGDIYHYSKHNDIAHLVGYALEEEGLIAKEDEHFAKFQKAQYMAIFRQENQDYELNRACSALEAAGIDFMPLKGSVIRRMYPAPWMRTSCDVDILVKKEDFDDARKCMLEVLGYRQGKESPHDESFNSDNGVHIELHFDLVEEGRTAKSWQVLAKAWEGARAAEGKKHQMLMSDEMFYFYHIAHTAKHFESGGVGMRPFLDLYILKRDTSNEEKRQELLRLGEIDTFEAVAKSIAQSWFEGGELDEVGLRAERFVLLCGTYGSVYNMMVLEKEKLGRGFKYLFKRVFMPFESVKCAYPILDKHKWLFPFCQIARWFKLLSPKRAKRAAREVQRAHTEFEGELQKMNELLRDVGLKKTV